VAIATRVLTIFSLIVALIALGASDASATHSWSTYHWARTANPFTLALGSNTTGDWTDHLATTSTNWSKSTVLDTTVVAGSTSGRKCRPSSGTVQVCNAAYGSNGWLGLAQIWLSGGHIYQGVAKMNDSYFNLAKYNNPNEKQHVMCQEVGHTFGLGHTSEDGSSQDTCMDYFSNTGANAGSTLSTAPNQHDYDQLALIYAHLDSTSTVKAVVAAPGASGFAGRDGDGTPAGASKAKGRWYIESLGAGRYLVTHITWAD